MLDRAFRSKSKGNFYQIASKHGFRVEEVPIGTSFTNYSGEDDVVNAKNSVRLGNNRTLYVGFDRHKQIDLSELAHDVAACVTGIDVPSDQTSFIRPETITEVAKRSTGKVLTLKDLHAAAILANSRDKGLVVPSSYLFDAIVYYKTFPLRYIEKA